MLFVNSIEAKEVGVKRERESKTKKGEELKEAEGKTQRGKIQSRTHLLAKGSHAHCCNVGVPRIFLSLLCKYYRLMFVLLLLSLLLLRAKENYRLATAKNPNTEKKHTHTLEVSSHRDEASNKKIFFNSEARNHSQ